MDSKFVILRLQETCAQTGNSKSTTYKEIAEGNHPKPVRIGARAVGWVQSEIEEYNRQKIAARDSEVEIEIRKKLSVEARERQRARRKTSIKEGRDLEEDAAASES